MTGLSAAPVCLGQLAISLSHDDMQFSGVQSTRTVMRKRK